jgi:mRNA interferase RelE/StbE
VTYYRVEFRPAAARELRKLDRSARERISKVISLLTEEPRPPAAKMLTCDDTPRLWRVRSADYRVIYSIEDDVLLVLVINVRHRREAYGR